MRLLGVAHAGLKLFRGKMDMRPPVSKSFFSDLNKKILTACKTIAEQVMLKAAADEKDETQQAGVFPNPDWMDNDVVTRHVDEARLFLTLWRRNFHWVQDLESD